MGEYELQIRREYRLVPGPVFRRRRAQLLRTLLDAGSLFNTVWFKDRSEAVARQNLASALEDLQ